MTTSAPPYKYPRQKPTSESGDEDGEILVKRESGWSEKPYTFMWTRFDRLHDGDVWVPGCDQFFRDWAASNVTCFGVSSRKWGVACSLWLNCDVAKGQSDGE